MHDSTFWVVLSPTFLDACESIFCVLIDPFFSAPAYQDEHRVSALALP
jgi:hypothetical protein